MRVVGLVKQTVTCVGHLPPPPRTNLPPEITIADIFPLPKPNDTPTLNFNHNLNNPNRDPI